MRFALNSPDPEPAATFERVATAERQLKLSELGSFLQQGPYFLCHRFGTTVPTALRGG